MAETAGETPAGQSASRWREIIKHTITGITALGIFGALVFQGVGTYLQYLVSKDQLAQSTEENDDRLRDQASKIAVWAADTLGNGRVEIRVMNRSLGPVYGLSIDIEGTSLQGEHQAVRYGVYDFGFGTLAPCTLLVISGNDGLYRSAKPKEELKLVHVKIEALEFRDGVGRRWYKTGGELTQDEAEHLKYGERRTTAIQDGEYDEHAGLSMRKVETGKPEGCTEE